MTNIRSLDLSAATRNYRADAAPTTSTSAPPTSVSTNVFDQLAAKHNPPAEATPPQGTPRPGALTGALPESAAAKFADLVTEADERHLLVRSVSDAIAEQMTVIDDLKLAMHRQIELRRTPHLVEQLVEHGLIEAPVEESAAA